MSSQTKAIVAILFFSTVLLATEIITTSFSAIKINFVTFLTGGDYNLLLLIETLFPLALLLMMIYSLYEDRKKPSSKSNTKVGNESLQGNNASAITEIKAPKITAVYTPATLAGKAQSPAGAGQKIEGEKRITPPRSSFIESKNYTHPTTAVPEKEREESNIKDPNDDATSHLEDIPLGKRDTFIIEDEELNDTKNNLDEEL